jgi:hypothetical protein
MLLEKRYLHEPEVLQEVQQRIEKLQPDTQNQWGKMDVAQMMEHCAVVQEVLNGEELTGTPFLIKLFGGLIKKSVLSDKPYAKSMQTHPKYRIVSEQDFEQAKSRLIRSLEEFATKAPQDSQQYAHPIFGPMDLEERAWSSYKHLNHHLEQFGV